MLYREVGEFKTSYKGDQQVFNIGFDKIAYYCLLFIAFFVIPFFINDYWANAILLPFLILGIASIGLNILTGYCGQVSLGSGGFMAVGAYACYKLMTSFPDLNIIICILLSGGITAIVGALFGLPSLRIKGFYLAVICSIFWTILRSVEFIGIGLKDKAAQTESKVDDGLIPFAIDLTKVIIVIFALVIILGNVFNVNITALVAGLGVGGVAIALASKESLENLLGSFTIFFDKPFAVGDIITLGGVTGVVEKVGFRSTRIRTYDKSIVTVPNKNIINTELDNLGVRPVRRVKFNIGLTYDTKIEQIKNIVDDIQKLVDDHPMTNEDGRVRFLSFGASSLDIMVLYYVNSPEWEDLIDAQQKINYSIIEIVNKHNSEFAFPSTSVYIEKNSN